MEDAWNKPELVVLVRRMSDEVLDANCKALSAGGPRGQIKGKCYPATSPNCESRGGGGAGTSFITPTTSDF